MDRSPEVLDVGRVKLLMKARGWTQYRLAKESDVDAADLSKILNDQVPPPDPRKSSIPYKVARAFDVPMDAVLTVGRKHWYRIDFADRPAYRTIIAEMAYAKCIKACSRTLCSYLLPDEACLELSAMQHREWGLCDEAIAKRHATAPDGYEHRRRLRENREYAHQVIGPESALRQMRRRGRRSWLRYLDRQLKNNATLTNLGLIPTKAWKALDGEIGLLTGFESWSKVNVAGDYVAVVWHRTEVHYTHHKDTIEKLSDEINACAEKTSRTPFVAGEAKFDPLVMAKAQEEASRYLRQTFSLDAIKA